MHTETSNSKSRITHVLEFLLFVFSVVRLILLLCEIRQTVKSKKSSADCSGRCKCGEEECYEDWEEPDSESESEHE